MNWRRTAISSRDLASQVISAQEDERRRVSRELHDDTAQVLFAQLLHVTALKSSDDPRIQEVAGRLEQSTVAALEGVRRLALELRPPALDDLGLAEALGELCQRFRESTGCAVKLDVRGMRGRLSAEVELVLYRVAQEALTNVAKHAKATLVNIDLERTEHDVSLSVKDDGTGFDRSRFSPSDGVGLGLGLFGMEERATLLGGTLRIWSTPGHGTEVFAFVPLHRHETPSSTDPRDRPITVVLADDHGIVRAGLRALLEMQPDMRVIGEAEDAAQAVTLVLRSATGGAGHRLVDAGRWTRIDPGDLGPQPGNESAGPDRPRGRALSSAGA